MQKTWVNGQFTDTAESVIPVTDRGLTLGDGVFDTMLAQDGKPVWAREHFARLSYNASMLGIDFTLDFEAIAETLLEQNDAAQGRYAVRTTITRGSGARGLMPPDTVKPTIIMGCAPAPQKTNRVELVIAQTVRRNEHSPLSKIKSLNYGDNILALIEARDKGAEDALMLNGAGHVCCATAGNIFVQEQDRLLTPPLDDGVLSGITRQKIIESHDVTEESIAPERLFEADAVFITNSIQGLRQVKRIDHTYFQKAATLPNI
ncbi:MAG: aminotransferase class IV [Rhodospirillales bacterium]|nr:aminotransferase class IV [Rhodospirillales bacterium]MCB9995094.1 aminotransferase class IV [Rhodospirillales bacterium]